jgi:hypothetical protein
MISSNTELLVDMHAARAGVCMHGRRSTTLLSTPGLLTGLAIALHCRNEFHFLHGPFARAQIYIILYA